MRTISTTLVAALLACASSAYGATCARFPASASTARDQNGAISVPLRTDYPASPPGAAHPWSAINFRTDWQSYIGAVLAEVRGSKIAIRQQRVRMPAAAPWWITPWMDFGGKGREPNNGLTRERSPDAGDLSPTSKRGYQTWAVGWYNTEGAYSLGQVFADPCDPKIPATPGQKWTFADGTVGFKFLFSTAPPTEVAYLSGAPQVTARVNGADLALRLLQVDVAVRDPRATDTGWVFGTFVWKGPAQGDRMFDNLVPVGLMWGNEHGAMAPAFADWLNPLEHSRINEQLAGVVWQGPAGGWPQRPYPGFQGRLNGPADNWRSSCVACHAAAQFPASPTLRPQGSWNQASPPDMNAIKGFVARYFSELPGGDVADPAVTGAIALDYSLQLQEAFIRMCQACDAGAMTGARPALCRRDAQGPACAPAASPAGNAMRQLLRTDTMSVRQ